MDKYKRVLVCPVCKSQHFKDDKCTKCNTYIFNYCSDYITNAEDGCSYANPSNSRFCEMCEKPTYFYRIGILDPWQDFINNIVKMQINP